MRLVSRIDFLGVIAVRSAPESVIQIHRFFFTSSLGLLTALRYLTYQNGEAILQKLWCAIPNTSFTARFHRAIGVAVIAFTLHLLAHAMVTGKNIHPFNTVGWLHEQLSVGLVLLVLGVEFLVLTPRSRSQTNLAAAAAAVVLALVVSLIYIRFFWRSIAIVGLAAWFDVALIGLCEIRGGKNRGIILLIGGMVSFLLSSLFLSFSVMWVGA